MAGKILKISRGGDSNRSATLVVAANNATAKSKAAADYVCDGTADQVQIQAALNVVSGGCGGKVRLSEGCFNITACIVMKPKCALEGMWRGAASCIQAAANLSSMISFPSGVQNEYCRLAHLGLTGDSSNGYNVTWGIDAYNLNLSIIKDVAIELVHGGGIYLRAHESGKVAWLNTLENIVVDFNGTLAGGTGSNTYRISATDNSLVNCYGTGGNANSYGFFIDGNGNRIVGCHSDHSSGAGYKITSNSNNIVGCVAENNTTYGFYFYASSPAILWNTLTGCNAYLNTGTDIVFDGTGGITVTGNVCHSTNDVNSIKEINSSDYNVIVSNVCEKAISTIGIHSIAASNVII